MSETLPELSQVIGYSEKCNAWDTFYEQVMGDDKKWKLSLFPANIIGLKFPLFPSEYNWIGKKFKIVLDVMLGKSKNSWQYTFAVSDFSFLWQKLRPQV